MTKPIQPEQMATAKAKVMPAEVIKAFNDLIIQRWDGRRATVPSYAAMTLVSAWLDCDHGTIVAKGWLDIEDIFRDAGWDVNRDSDNASETSFTFSLKAAE